MSLVDQSIATVRNAASRFKKKPLAARAGVSDMILRKVHEPSWDPRSTSLRRLEAAAVELEKEHGPAADPAHRETSTQVPVKGDA